MKQLTLAIFLCVLFSLSNYEFLCIMQKKNENDASIYRMSLEGKNAKLLVKYARTRSASAP